MNLTVLLTIIVHKILRKSIQGEY